MTVFDQLMDPDQRARRIGRVSFELLTELEHARQLGLTGAVRGSDRLTKNALEALRAELDLWGVMPSPDYDPGPQPTLVRTDDLHDGDVVRQPGHRWHTVAGEPTPNGKGRIRVVFTDKDVPLYLLNAQTWERRDG